VNFRNEIQLALPPDALFAALSDVERVAPCLPGARLAGRQGDEYQGAMRVKVGPVVVDYAGTLVFEELDTEARRAVLHARGQEEAGQGSAEARIVNSVEADGDGSRIVVETELQVRGKVAQFGSAPMEKIAKRMFAEFAKNLEEMMTGGPQSDAGPLRDGKGASTGNGPAPATPAAERYATKPEALNLVGLLTDSVPPWVFSTAVPSAGALLAGYLLGRLRSRLR
jgi:uncharacterized protein